MYVRKSIVLSLLAVVTVAVWPSLRELAASLAIEESESLTVVAAEDTVATAVFAVG